MEAGEHKPGRDLDAVTPEMIERATGELVALVRARLPERFYGGEAMWRVIGTGMIARMTGIVESMILLVRAQRPSDTSALLRVLFEHVVTFCWIAIDPDARMGRWTEHSRAQRLRLHNDAQQFGIEDVLKGKELELAREAKLLPRLTELTAEVDEYWSARSEGFRAQPVEGPKHILTLRGIYTAVYRTVSRTAHAQIETVDPCVDLHRYPHVVDFENDDSLVWSAMAIPLFAMALIVCNDRFGWPDGNTVRAINDSLVRDDQ